MRHLESIEQQTIFSWARASIRKYPELELLHSSQAGVRFSSPSVAKRAKAEGMMAGLPDIHLPIPRGGHASLYIELKAAKGRLSDTQKDVLAQLSDYGNHAVVCYGAQQAIDVIKSYLEGSL